MSGAKDASDRIGCAPLAGGWRATGVAIALLVVTSAALTFVPWLHAHGLYLRDAVMGTAVQAGAPGSAAGSDLIRYQAWRLLAAMWVHLDWKHWLANVMAGSGLLLLFARTARPQVSFAVLVACGLIVQVALIFVPSVHWYGGLSGALHGLAIWGALRLMTDGGNAALVGVGLAAFLGIKLWLEQSWLAPVVFDTGWRFGVVRVAHAIGAAAGIAIWMLASRMAARRDREVDRAS